MGKTEKVKIVVVQHQNNPASYVFSVPEDAYLNAGDFVLCDTKKGKNQIGCCTTPSYEIDEDFLYDLFRVKKAELKPVKGKMFTLMYDEDCIPAAAENTESNVSIKDKDGCF